ncbi:MAG: esterase-like activity of phytase family protein [Blastocatellia bacterium]|nr:esterase-like activity of phytase family protein [Blastocatellia bacterium]
MRFLISIVLCGVFAVSLKSTEPVTSATMLPGTFRRIATFDVNGAVAEIVAATPDGRTLIYTNSADKKIGFVNIADPAAPVEMASLSVDGEPTSVAATPDGRWALAVVDGTPDKLVVLDLSDRTIEASLNLGGQPDSIAISGDGRYAAIAIENERDETLNGGRMPQGPAGFLTIVDLDGEPAKWKTRDVSLLGLATRFPEDPEPEFIDINGANQAAVTLQENNHVVIVNLADGKIVSHWTAGVTTHAADTSNNGEVSFTSQIANARREPDAILWTPGGRLITSNEGDYTIDLAGGFAGSRDFTIFSPDGTVVYEPGASLEQAAALVGHYPDSRSGSKGAEPEGGEVGVFAGVPYAFVASERGDFIAVYRIDDETRPVLAQILPTGDAPEGLAAIPQRNLLVSANEGDGSLSIYLYTAGTVAPTYPQVESGSVWWSAVSGLAQDAAGKIYAVPDSAIRPSRIYTMSQGDPLRVESSMMLSKNYDLEGIAIRPEGGFWVCSEGAGNAGAATATKNLIIQIAPDGTIVKEVELPAAVNAQQISSGFEGVTTSRDGSQVYVAFQREWRDDPAGFVKIGRYTPATGEWAFYRYPIDTPPSVTGAWVGLSEIVRIDDATFAVIERDNQMRENARVKRLYTFSIAGVTPAPAGQTPPLLTKTLARDLLKQDGFLVEKAEGLLFTSLGDWVVVSDNDGAGETRVTRILNAGYDACLQDERSGDVLRFNTRTGAYLFVRCGGLTMAGRGAIQRDGCSLRLSDARLNAVIEDCSFGEVKSGRALFRPSPLGATFLLNDANLGDNTCGCR